MKIKYHLVKNMPTSNNWEDESDWTMVTDINDVRIGHLTMSKEKLMERLIKAHGQPCLSRGDGKLSLCGVWPGRDVTYMVSYGEGL
jgi:hypothetical protein